MFVEFELGFLQIGNVDDLHLPDHERIGCCSGKSATCTGNFAIKEAPATTEGSSSVIGTSTSLPFTIKFNAIPKGRLYKPITFSSCGPPPQRRSACCKREQVLGSLSGSVQKLGTALVESHIIKSRNAGICHHVTFTKLIVCMSSAKIYHIL